MNIFFVRNFELIYKNIYKMLSGHSPLVTQQPVSPNTSIRKTLNPSSDTPQIFKFYYPVALPTQQHNIKKTISPKQIKNYSYSIHNNNSAASNNLIIDTQKQETFLNAKRIHTECQIIEIKQPNIQQNTKKKPFFLKSQNPKVQKNIKTSNQFLSPNYNKIQSKCNNLQNNSLNKKTFFNRSKSPINRNKTQTFTTAVRKATRVSQIPIKTPKEYEKTKIRKKSGQFANDQERNIENNLQQINQNQIDSSFGPKKKNQYLNVTTNNIKIQNNGNKRLSSSPVKPSGNKSSSNLKPGDKGHSPSFIASKKSINRFSLIKLIGNSKFSEAYLCVQKKTLSIYCLKKIKKSLVNQNPAILDRFIRKLSLQFKSFHPNIIQIYDVFCDNEFVYLIEQFMEGKSLREYLDVQKNKKFEQHHKQYRIVEKIYTINSALIYIHEQKFFEKKYLQLKKNYIIHGDLRPQTILMNLGTCKISPVNPIKIEKKMSQIHSYISPQTIAEQNLTPKSDMWNLGLILFQLCAKRTLFKIKEHSYDKSLPDQIVNLDLNSQLASLSNTTQPLKQIIKSLLKIRPDDRMGSLDLLKANIVKIYGMKPQDLEQKKQKYEQENLLQKFKLDQKIFYLTQKNVQENIE